MNYNEQWVLYDSMIQSYRSNFIASQSLMLAVGALFINESLFLELFVAAVALFQTWYIWYRVIRVRAIISDFYKFNTLYDFSNKINSKGNVENNPKTPLTESIYAKNNEIRRRANSNLSKLVNNPRIKHNMRLTRIKLDLILPSTFSITWIVIIVYSICN